VRPLRWVGFVLLLAPATAGVFFALMAAGFSVMMFDAPDSTSHFMPYAVVAGAWLALPVTVGLLIRGVRAMIGGRTVSAYTHLAIPAALALAFLLWLKSA
jgi:hypothetical protein